MKTKHHRSFLKLWRKIFRQPAPAHDPWLSLNMTFFNYTDSWSRTFAKDKYGRDWA
jgi:hypothetical protein